MTIARELRRFLELLHARGLHRKTVRGYAIAIDALARFLRKRGKDDLRELTREDLVEHLLFLEHDEGLAPPTLSHRLHRLRRSFAYLQDAGLLLEDPTSGLKRRLVRSPLRAWLDEEEVGALLGASAQTRVEVRNRAALEILYSAGLRVSELVALELEDLDLTDGYVTVRTSKNGEGRTVPLGRKAIAALERYLADVRRAWVTEANGASARVFITRAGRPVVAGEIGKAVRRHALRAGITKRAGPHVLRHSFAVHLLRHGASIRHIQEMLGHRTLRSTEIYTHLLPLDLKRAHRRAHPAERRRPRLPQ